MMITEMESKKMQLRGGKLEAHLRAVLLSAICESEEIGAVYVYTQSGFSKKASVSRETVRKKQSFLDGLLDEFNLVKANSKVAQPCVELASRLSRVELELKNLKLKYKQLRMHHLEIFRSLHRHSLDFSQLIEPIIFDDFYQKECCTLCGGFLC